MASLSRRSNRNAVSNNINDVVVRGIESIVERQTRGTWIGTMSGLNTALNRVLSQRQRTLLPGSPGALRVVINRVANRIRSRGIGVRFGRTTDHSRTRFVRFAQ
jgi:hypothetical protein